MAACRYQGLPGGAGKDPTCQGRRHKRCWFPPWAGKVPWSRAWQATPGFLPGGSQGQRNLAGYVVYRVTKSWTWLKWLSTYAHRLLLKQGLHISQKFLLDSFYLYYSRWYLEYGFWDLNAPIASVPQFHFWKCALIAIYCPTSVYFVGSVIYLMHSKGSEPGLPSYWRTKTYKCYPWGQKHTSILETTQIFPPNLKKSIRNVYYILVSDQIENRNWSLKSKLQ